MKHRNACFATAQCYMFLKFIFISVISFHTMGVQAPLETEAAFVSLEWEFYRCSEHLEWVLGVSLLVSPAPALLLSSHVASFCITYSALLPRGNLVCLYPGLLILLIFFLRLNLCASMGFYWFFFLVDKYLAGKIFHLLFNG